MVSSFRLVLCWSFLVGCLLAEDELIDVVLQRANAREIERAERFINADDTEVAGVGGELEETMLVEFDIRVLKSEYQRTNAGHRLRRQVRIRERGSPFWDNGVVPFHIDSRHFSSSKQADIHNAMSLVSQRTCVRYVPLQSEFNYINITNSGGGCWSYVGRIPSFNGQTLSLGPSCNSNGVMTHELMHALGVHHEHNRPDRDDFIRVDFSNIRSSSHANYKRGTFEEMETYGRPYDYNSVMHYSAHSSAIDRSRPNIIALDPSKQSLIGTNRIGLNFLDIKLINRMYECNKRAGCSESIRCPRDGFVAKDCKCWCSTGDLNNPMEECEKSNPTTTTTRPTTTRPTTTRPTTTRPTTTRPTTTRPTTTTAAAKTTSSTSTTPRPTTTTTRSTTTTTRKPQTTTTTATTTLKTTTTPTTTATTTPKNTITTSKPTTTTAPPQTTTTPKPKATTKTTHRTTSVTTPKPTPKTTITTSSLPSCTNKHRDCDEFARRGYCSNINNDVWMLKNCPVSCYCDQKHNGRICEAKDSNSLCVEWATRGFCDGQHARYMSTNCSLSCNTCCNCN